MNSDATRIRHRAAPPAYEPSYLSQFVHDTDETIAHMLSPGAVRGNTLHLLGSPTTSTNARVGDVWAEFSQQIVVPAFNGKPGATSGWVVTGVDDGLARLPASQTSSTLVVPIVGLEIGDTITGAFINGQVESAGNNASLTLSLRKSTAVAADFTDAELDNVATGTLTSDTLLSATNAGITGLSEVIASTEYIYALITATTAASTDIAVGTIVVSVTKSGGLLKVLA